MVEIKNIRYWKHQRNRETGMNNNRYDHIDLLECAAMLFVIIYHGTTAPFDFIEYRGVVPYINYLVRPILSICVPLFFMANGYLLFGKPLDLKKHILKIIKIIIITVIWRILTVAVLLLLMPDTGRYSVKEYFMEVLRADQGYISHLWFMGALVCIYIFFPLLKIVYDKNLKIFIYFICVCSIMTFGNKLINMLMTLISIIFMGNIGGAEDINYFNMFNPFAGTSGYTLVYFGIGGLLYHAQDKIKEEINRKHNCIAIVSIIFSVLVLAGWGFFRSKVSGKIWDIVWNSYDTLFTLLIAMMTFFLSLNYRPSVGSKTASFIQTISSNTLGIYFLHVIILYPTLVYIKRIPLFQNMGMNVIYAFGVMCISILLALIIKKIPGIGKLL